MRQAVYDTRLKHRERKPHVIDVHHRGGLCPQRAEGCIFLDAHRVACENALP